MCSIVEIMLVFLLWACSNRSMSFLILGTPEVDAALQDGSHQSRVAGHSPFPYPAGHAALDAAQDTTGFLGCEHAVPAHVQPLIYPLTSLKP